MKQIRLDVRYLYRPATVPPPHVSFKSSDRYGAINLMMPAFKLGLERPVVLLITIYDSPRTASCYAKGNSTTTLPKKGLKTELVRSIMRY